jgi:hypothetical protein
MKPKTAVQLWMPVVVLLYGALCGDPLTGLFASVAALFLVWLAWHWDRWAWATVTVERAESPDWLTLELEPPPAPTDAATSARPRRDAVVHMTAVDGLRHVRRYP